MAKKWFLNCPLCGIIATAVKEDKEWKIICGSEFVNNGCGLSLKALPDESKHLLIERWNKLNNDIL